MWKIAIVEDNHLDASSIIGIVEQIMMPGSYIIVPIEYAFQPGEINANEYFLQNQDETKVHIAIVDGHFGNEKPYKSEGKSYNSAQLGALLIEKYLGQPFPYRFMFVTGYLVDKQEIFKDFQRLSNQERVTALPKNMIINRLHPDHQKGLQDFEDEFRKFLRDIAIEKIQKAPRQTKLNLEEIATRDVIDLDTFVVLKDNIWQLKTLLAGWWDSHSINFEKDIKDIMLDLLHTDVSLEASKALAVHAAQQITHNNDNVYFDSLNQYFADEVKGQIDKLFLSLKNLDLHFLDKNEQIAWEDYIGKLHNFSELVPRNKSFSQEMQTFRKENLQFKSMIRPYNGAGKTDASGYFCDNIRQCAEKYKQTLTFFQPGETVAVLELYFPFWDIFRKKLDSLFEISRRESADYRMGVSFFSQPTTLVFSNQGYDCRLHEQYLIFATDSRPLLHEKILSEDPPTILTIFNRIDFFGRYYLGVRNSYSDSLKIYDCTRDLGYFPIKKITLGETTDRSGDTYLKDVLDQFPAEYNNFFIFKFLTYKPLLQS